ncbi:hypothetical protein JW905_05770 [bacterium]|nr:hypothetical protein [candidate division CSSED10-310 bacterium]
MKSAVKVLAVTLLLLSAVGLLVIRLAPQVLPGNSWDQLPAPPGEITAMVVAPDTGTIYAAVRNSEDDATALWVSASGREWTSAGVIPDCAEATGILLPPPDGGRQSILVTSFASHTVTGGIFLSTNGGAEWRDLCTGLPSSDIRVAWLHPGGTRLYVAMARDGVAGSDDMGASWRLLNQGLTDLRVQTLCISPDDADNLLAGTLKGLFRSTDGGDSWQPSSGGMSTVEPFVLLIIADPTMENTFYALERTPGIRTHIYRSRDGGETWRLLGEELPAEFHPRSLLADPAHPGTIYMGTVYDGVYAGTGYGDSWRQWSTGIPLDQPIIIHSLALRDGDAPTLLAATNRAGLLFSRRLPRGIAGILSHLLPR